LLTQPGRWLSYRLPGAFLESRPGSLFPSAEDGDGGLDLFDCLLEFHPKIKGLFMAEYPAEHLRKHRAAMSGLKNN